MRVPLYRYVPRVLSCVSIYIDGTWSVACGTQLEANGLDGACGEGEGGACMMGILSKGGKGAKLLLYNGASHKTERTERQGGPALRRICEAKAREK